MFSVVREMRLDQNEERPVHFALDPERIKIFVDEDVYSAYIQYQNNITMRPLIFSVLVMPALTFMMEELRNGYEEYESYRWFLKFSKGNRFCRKFRRETNLYPVGVCNA